MYCIKVASKYRNIEILEALLTLFSHYSLIKNFFVLQSPFYERK